MRRPQFTLRALLVLILMVACFFGGIRFERRMAERRADAVRLTIITDSDFDWAPLPEMEPQN